MFRSCNVLIIVSAYKNLPKSENFDCGSDVENFMGTRMKQNGLHYLFVICLSSREISQGQFEISPLISPKKFLIIIHPRECI